jgi:ADP-ribosyl-[dinitrogen reductase] hydrolase
MDGDGSDPKVIVVTDPNALPGDEYFAIERDEANMVVKSCKLIDERLKYKGGGSWGFWGGGSSGTELCRYSMFHPDDPDFEPVKAYLYKGVPFTSWAEDRCFGTMFGMVMGDALGAPMEFRAVRYDDEHRLINDLEHDCHGSFGLLPGQWTDDASMGLCLADSLLWCRGLDVFDLKVRFLNWWEYGYNNAFRLASMPQHSIGLGGNISMSFSEFKSTGAVYTRQGDKETCGNGSLMRNGAPAAFFHDDYEAAVNCARQQSYLTHQGTEAAECCALLAHLVHKAINTPGITKEELLGNIDFKTECPGVIALTASMQENPTPGKNWNLEDRNWQWRAPTYRYAPGRARMQPGYVGSYAMDALSMALHCVWSTNTMTDAMLKAANRCGDADSVTSVTGQLAGALYGASAIPKHWFAVTAKWDNNETGLRAYKMFHKKPARYSKTS